MTYVANTQPDDENDEDQQASSMFGLYHDVSNNVDFYTCKWQKTINQLNYSTIQQWCYMVEQMVDINLYSYSGRCDTVRDLLYVLFIFSYGKDLKKHPHIKFDMLLRLSNIITVSKLCRRLDMADHACISYVSKTSDTL